MLFRSTNVFSFNITEENLKKRKSFICFSKPPRFYYLGFNDPKKGLFDDVKKIHLFNNFQKKSKITGESLIENKSNFSIEDFEKIYEPILIRHRKIFIEIDANLSIDQVLENTDDEIEYATKPKFYLSVLGHHFLLNGMTNLVKESFNVLKESYPNTFVKSFSFFKNFAIIPAINGSLK